MSFYNIETQQNLITKLMKKTLLFLCILFFGIHHSQTYYFQNFNTGGLNGWTSTDLDGDSYSWYIINGSYPTDPNFGSGFLASSSFFDVPNNLITSPLINLTGIIASNLRLTYDLKTSTSYPNEKYSVYITTSSNPSVIIASTPVYTEIVATGGFQSRIIDLTSYIGQQVYISFRHYDCNMNSIDLDNIVVESLLNYNGMLSGNFTLDRYSLINTDNFIVTKVKNLGTQPVNNITVNWSDGITNHPATISIPTITTGQEVSFTHPIPVNYSSGLEKNITVSLTHMNGVVETDLTNNSKNTKTNFISQNSPKKVLIEEGTGTWCGWCPEGAVAMAYMDNNYANNYIGIAVHNNDPMTVTEYNAGAQISAFPGMNIDRVVLDYYVNQTFMESAVNARKNMLVPVMLNASSALSGNSLSFNASATFRTNFSNANFRFAAILVEDGVQGTTSGYNQKNYYAGGYNGPMGGYESLPGSVPASQMVYNHVGRMLIGGYYGQAGSIPSVITDGQVVNYLFNVTIPSTYNTNNLKVVLLLLDASTGEVVNSRSFLLNTLGTSSVETNKNYLTVYPNPASEYIKIQAEKNVDLKFYDASGKLVLEKTNVSPDTTVSVSGLTKGIYIVSIKEKDSAPKTKKLIIK